MEILANPKTDSPIKTILDLKPGRELDVLIAEKVMGWLPGGANPLLACPAGGSSADEGQTSICTPPNYSTEIGAAWAVIERLFLQYQFRTILIPDWQNYWLAHVYHRDEDIYIAAHSYKTAPEAICKAALLAIGLV